MATFTWTGAAGDDNWNNAANWSPSGVPGAGDSAVITPAAATAIGVGGITVGALTDSATVTLTDGNGSNFALGAGGASSSTTFSNGGTLTIDSTGSTTNFILNDSATTLTGGGTVLLSDNGNNRLYGAAGADTLTNVNNVIKGAGQFGIGQLTFVNDKGGTVDATSATNALTLDMAAPVLNSGLLESTGAAGLVIQNTTINQTAGGTIGATGKGAVVVLNSATIQGGTLTTAAGGLIETGGTGSLDGTVAQVVNKGTFAVQNGTNLYLSGTIDNAGTIQENAAGNTTNIILGYPTVTLTGGGTVVLSNSGNNRIYGNSQGYTLTNVNNTIVGAGQIGVGQTVLVNEAKGVIDANQATGLTLDTGNDVINTGLIEATGTGGLQITNTNIVNQGGTLAATGTGAHVDLSGATIEGGTVAATSGGVIDTSGNGGLDGYDHGALTLVGTFAVSNATNLALSGTIDNTGTIAENAGVNTTNIILNSRSVTLTGGGTVALSNSDNNRIYGSTAGFTLVNVNNVIEGTGQLGVASMALVNEAGGVIDANNAPIMNLSSGVLTINCSNGVTNAGLIEDTGTAGLSIVNSGVNNLGGTITATGAGTSVTINNSNIEGGLLAGTGGGTVVLVSGASLDGSEAGIGAITLAGNVQVANNNTAYLNGTIDNTGTLTVNSAGNTTELRLATQTVTLTGGGTLLLSNNASNYVFGNASGFVLDNVNNLIEGAGNLGDAQMTLLNAAGGTIDGNTTTGLTLNCNDGVTNQGLIESTAGGGLSIVNTNVDNAGGTITAAGAGAGLTLSNSTVEGGLLKTSGGGIVYGSSNAYLDGSQPDIGAVTNAGSLQVVNNNAVYLGGTIDNTGVINVDSAGNTTELRINTETVTLTGSGTILLSDNTNNYVFGNSSYYLLDNTDNTISGAGQLGDGQMALTNTGTVDASGTNALVLNTGSYDVTNGAGGLIEATGTGGLSFTSGIFSNAGMVAAAGGNVTFGSGVANLNSLNGTLTGGAWEATGGGTLAIDGGAISVDAATIVIAGAGSAIQTGSGSTFTDLGASLTTIAAGGSLTIGNKGALTVTATSLADAGAITFSGGTLTAKAVAVANGATLTGFGTVKGGLSDSGAVTANGGTLSVTGNVSGKGSVTINNNATFSIGGKDTVASIAFASGGTETLALAKPAGATSVISGFGSGDVIDLTKSAATSLSYSGNTTSGTLTVKNGSTTVATLKFMGNYTTASFALSAQGNGVAITGTGHAAAAFVANPPAFDAAAVHTPDFAPPLPAAAAAAGVRPDSFGGHVAQFVLADHGTLLMPLVHVSVA